MTDPQQRHPGRPAYRLPRSWVVRVVVAWFLGFGLILLVGAVTGERYVAVGFWTLLVVLAGFAFSDWRRTRRSSPE